ncbi:MAG: phage holin family protein [Bacilli bacterium]|nr:phage holin family protein [Bacilli bacterium]
MENVSVPIIVIVCYLFGELYKGVCKENTRKLIPIIVAILGGIMGVVMYLTNKELMFNVSNIWTALLIGIVSGVSSTGTNQIIKKIFKKEEGEKENE